MTLPNEAKSGFQYCASLKSQGYSESLRDTSTIRVNIHYDSRWCRCHHHFLSRLLSVFSKILRAVPTWKDFILLRLVTAFLGDSSTSVEFLTKGSKILTTSFLLQTSFRHMIYPMKKTVLRLHLSLGNDQICVVWPEFLILQVYNYVFSVFYVSVKKSNRTHVSMPPCCWILLKCAARCYKKGSHKWGN